MAAANPLRALQDPLRYDRRLDPCAMLILGANGDLTRRMLIPALYQLACDRRLPPSFAVLGNSRTPMTDEQFREKMRDGAGSFLRDGVVDEDTWRDFAAGLFYEPGDVRDPACCARLAARLATIDRERRTEGNLLLYLATQPSHYDAAVEGAGAAGLARGRGWRRVVVEKPFGSDYASAAALDSRLQQVFDENQIYRIDHYLGKETVQNMLAFRFGNGIFEPLWNRRYVNHVQITAAETIGVEGRGSYYQEAGALRDMIQNHLLQVLATMAMEPPAVFEPQAVRDERAKLLRSVRVMKPEDVPPHAVAGQYGPSRSGGQELPGFRQEPGVAPDAQTDTYAAATFFIDNWRWAGVPFYVRSGKRLPRRITDVAIQFNSAPHALFTGEHHDSAPWSRPNILVLRIQPEEGISLRFLSKFPGSGMKLRPVSMDFQYGSSFGARSPSAYETLLV
ncbi:MAG: glucose-6-phosphate dehydrogenase, partial [Bryobacteraceae bacterium]